MKQLISYDPVFTPGAAGAGTIDFSQIPNFQGDLLYGVINVTRNQILYAPGSSTYGGTFRGAVLTLTFNTSSYATNDQLSIFYETPPGSTYLDNNVPIEKGGMLEAHYILLMQILTELKVQTFLLADEFRINRQDIEALRNEQTSPTSSPDSTGLG